jgi:hypothetical protein
MVERGARHVVLSSRAPKIGQLWIDDITALEGNVNGRRFRHATGASTLSQGVRVRIRSAVGRLTKISGHHHDGGKHDKKSSGWAGSDKRSLRRRAPSTLGANTISGINRSMFLSDDPTKAPSITVKPQKEKYGLRDAEVVMNAYLSILSIFSRNPALWVEDGRPNQGAKAGDTKLGE